MVSQRGIDKAAARTLRMADRVDRFEDRAIILEDRIREPGISVLEGLRRIYHMVGYEAVHTIAIVSMIPRALIDNRTLEIGQMLDLREGESRYDFLVRRAESIDLGNITEE